MHNIVKEGLIPIITYRGDILSTHLCVGRGRGEKTEID
jgi:hypothetical protein